MPSNLQKAIALVGKGMTLKAAAKAGGCTTKALMRALYPDEVAQLNRTLLIAVYKRAIQLVGESGSVTELALLVQEINRATGVR